jgi:hypothetical protein
MTNEIRQLPAVEVRVETGPAQFGDDWPGVFLRGDDAMNFAAHLELLLKGEQSPITRAVVEGLLDDLRSSNLVLRGG